MKILYVVKNLRLSNGVASYSMNYFRELVKKKNQVDFLLIDDIPTPYYEEINKEECNVWIMPSYKKQPQKIISYLKNLFEEQNYDIIHCHVLNSGSLILAIAKQMGVPVRILHSHATQSGDERWKEYRNIPFKKMSLYCANYYFSCSELAGNCLFGKRNFKVIPNAIDISKYSFDSSKRKEIRRKNNVDDKYIIGTVGRLTKQKNPYFIIDIISEVDKRNIDFCFWWFGSGELDEKVKIYAEEKKISHRIKFWGSVQNVYEYYNAIDTFILPSLYEGLPVVGIEAQVAGVTVLLADTITKETQISAATIFLPIDNINCWVEKIIEKQTVNHEDNLKKIKLEKYMIGYQAECLNDLYQSLLERI